jgi:hypothetical protein
MKDTPEATASDWREKFRNTKFAKGGGACFECCDYEAMYSELEALFASEIAAATARERERCVGIIKAKRSEYTKRANTAWTVTVEMQTCDDIIKAITSKV